MTAYRAITTCNAEGWEKTGRRMAQSFVKHWQGVELTVYAEGFSPDVEGVRVAHLPLWLDAMKATRIADADARGMASGTYNYRRDCLRFAHKVAAITDNMAPKGDGTLIWLDADTLTFEEVTPDWLDRLWDGDETSYLAWLGRKNTYPECGFMMFRITDLGPHAWFMSRLATIYKTGEVFGLPETHDSFVIQHVMQTMQGEDWHREAARPSVHNLSGPKSHRGHPWLGSRLAEKMDHLKGARKALGRTPKHERTLKDGAAYWS